MIIFNNRQESSPISSLSTKFLKQHNTVKRSSKKSTSRKTKTNLTKTNRRFLQNLGFQLK